MQKYDTLDTLLLATIDTTPRKLAAIYVGDVSLECTRIASAEVESPAPFGVSALRICERRLQALRKAGRLRSTSRGWVRT